MSVKNYCKTRKTRPDKMAVNPSGPERYTMEYLIGPFGFVLGYDFSGHFQLSFNINSATNVYGLISRLRPGTFLIASYRRGFTKDILKVNSKTVYSTVAVPPGAFPYSNI